MGQLSDFGFAPVEATAPAPPLPPAARSQLADLGFEPNLPQAVTGQPRVVSGPI